MSLGGASILHMGGSAYFIAAGLGILLAGVLIALGKIAGAWVYAAVVVGMAGWSLAEVGADFGQLLPRLAIPILICLYIFSDKVRPRLS